MPRLFVFHLLNDFSGSPKVLGQLLRGWVSAGYQVSLQTSNNKNGFLTDIQGVDYTSNHYRFFQFLPFRLLALLYAQSVALLRVLFFAEKNDIIYVNTLLPFGAAIGGKIRGAKVIYHIHETSITPRIFKDFLRFWVNFCATEVIYVSNFLAQAEPFHKPSTVCWNALEDDFVLTAIKQRKQSWSNDQVLMIASLKAYKGLEEYIALATALPQLNFDLVLNASPQQIAAYFAPQSLPPNLVLYPAQKNVHLFYQRADLVMNLSRPEEWKETFGLTALEAMSYGIPVIVPPVGGIAEIVEDFTTGFHLNGKDIKGICRTIEALRTAPTYYCFISEEAVARAAKFSESCFITSSIAVIEGAARPTLNNVPLAR